MNLAEQDVINFLQQNPEFWLKCVDAMDGGKKDEKVTDLNSFKLKKVQVAAEKIEKRNKMLLQTSILNQKSTIQMHEFLAKFLECESYSDFAGTLNGEFKNTMNLDFTMVVNQKENSDKLDYINEIKQQNDGKKVVLRSLNEADNKLYGIENGAKVKSDAILMLDDGALVFASNDNQRFHIGQACDILEFVAKVVNYCIKRY